MNALGRKGLKCLAQWLRLTLLIFVQPPALSVTWLLLLPKYSDVDPATPLLERKVPLTRPVVEAGALLVAKFEWSTASYSSSSARFLSPRVTELELLRLALGMV